MQLGTRDALLFPLGDLPTSSGARTAGSSSSSSSADVSDDFFRVTKDDILVLLRDLRQIRSVY